MGNLYLAHSIGRALGAKIFRAGHKTAAVGLDVLSSPPLGAQAAEGLASAGLEVFYLSQIPAPVFDHAIHRMDLGGGIMVTGSCRPGGDHGFKLRLGREPIFGEQIQDLYRAIQSRDFVSRKGKIRSWEHLPSYTEEISSFFQIRRPLKVAIDCGNGAMGPLALEVLRRRGVSVIPLYCEPGGSFPDRLPDPAVPKTMEELARTVIHKGADCGLGFDGEGSRVVLIDERGRQISADYLLALCAREVLRQHPGGAVRLNDLCSGFLEKEIRRYGGVPIRGKAETSNVILSGDLSGHLVFHQDYLPIEDALYSALFFLNILSRSQSRTSDLFREFPKLFSTPEIPIACPDAAKFRVIAGLATRFRNGYKIVESNGVRVMLENGAWFLVQASDTAPHLIVRMEAKSLEELARAKEILLAALEENEELNAENLRTNAVRYPPASQKILASSLDGEFQAFGF